MTSILPSPYHFNTHILGVYVLCFFCSNWCLYKRVVMVNKVVVDSVSENKRSGGRILILFVKKFKGKWFRVYFILICMLLIIVRKVK